MKEATVAQVYGPSTFEKSVREFADFVESKTSSGPASSLLLSVVCSLGGIAAGYALLQVFLGLVHW